MYLNRTSFGKDKQHVSQDNAACYLKHIATMLTVHSPNPSCVKVDYILAFGALKECTLPLSTPAMGSICTLIKVGRL